MDERPDPSKPAPEEPTPEVAQLLRLIELQTAAQRERRSGAPKPLQGVSFRYGSLVVIIVFALGSVGLMEWVLSQLPKPPQPAASVAPAFSVLRDPTAVSGSAAGNAGGRAGSKY
jgi:hypothetical protein